MKLSASRPTVFLVPEVDQRIRHWTNLAAGEVSCVGFADAIEGGFVVSRVFLIPQVCGAAETEMDQEAVARLLCELDAAGEDLSRLRFWHHSHGLLRTFFSSQDEATIRALANGAWTVALVTNKSGDRQARLDVWDPVHVVLDEVPVDVFHADLGLRDDCEREFKERVRELPPTPRGDLPMQARLLADGRFDGDACQALFPDLRWEDFDELLDPHEPDGGDLDAGT